VECGLGEKWVVFLGLGLTLVLAVSSSDELSSLQELRVHESYS